MKVTYNVIILILALLVTNHQLQAKSGGKRKNLSSVTVSANTPLPVVTSGPAKITIQYVNPLHFQYSLQVSSTNITAPTPPASIAPSASVAGNFPSPPPPNESQPAPPPNEVSTPNAVASQPLTIDQLWENVVAQFKDVRETTFGLKQQTDKLLFTASLEQQCYKDRLSFYALFLLDQQTADALKQFAIHNRTPMTSGTSSNSASDSCRRTDDNWPVMSLQDDEKQLYSVQSALFDFAETSGFAEWKAKAPNGDNYSAISGAINGLLTQVQGLEATSDVAKTFQSVQVYNRFWRVKLEEIARSEYELAVASSNLQTALEAFKRNLQDANLKNAYLTARNAFEAAQQRNPLQLIVYVDCATNWYGRGRTDTITLHYSDITAAPATDQTTQIASSTCLTPGTVSTGIGMSFLQNRQFGFVSGRDPSNAANTISVIGATTDQQVTPLYAVQYNIALRDLENGLGLHAAVGAALGSSSGTANIELIAGPAISLKRRAFFITPAFQLGRRDELLPGYKIGDPQGNGLTSVPVHTGWQPGFALTFSFSVSQ